MAMAVSMALSALGCGILNPRDCRASSTSTSGSRSAGTGQQILSSQRPSGHLKHLNARGGRQRGARGSSTVSSSIAAQDGCQSTASGAEEPAGGKSEQFKPLRVLVSTGDVMGDTHAAGLVRSLARRAEAAGMTLDVAALGGGQLAAAGARLLGDNTGLSSIGLLEALPLVLPTLKLTDAVMAEAVANPPDVAILVDYPGVNIPLAKMLKKSVGCRVVYYIPPNEWLWNTSRTRTIVEFCDLILSVYPQEAEYYRSAGGQVELVGHPLVDLAHTEGAESRRSEARVSLGIPSGSVVVALMPASRPQELRHVWPAIAASARRVEDAAEFMGFSRSRDFHLQFVLPVVSEAYVPVLEEALRKHGLEDSTMLVRGGSDLVMAAADLAITKTGSVNMELALRNVPQVAVYRIDGVTAWIAKTLFRFSVPHISLVNLVLEEALVPEFIQDSVDPVAIANAASGLLPGYAAGDGARVRMREGYQRLRDKLGGLGATERAAEQVFSLAGRAARD